MASNKHSRTCTSLQFQARSAECSRIQRIAIAFAVALSASQVVRAADQLELQLVYIDEAPATVAITQVNSDWSLDVRSADATRTVDAASYVCWGSFKEQPGSPQLLLNDGTVLVGEVTRIDRESLTVASHLWGQVSIARKLARAFWLQPDANALPRDRRWKTLGQVNPNDQLYLQNGDVLSGKLLPTTEQDGSGLFGLVSVAIEVTGRTDKASIEIGEVDALTFGGPVFDSTSGESKSGECLLGFRDGSLLRAAELRQLEQSRMEIVTANGSTLQLDESTFVEQLNFVQPNSERITYLSDLSTSGYKSLPFLDLEWPLGLDENTLGGRLRASDAVVFKGIGMHSTSRVVFDLDRNYQYFEAELALDHHADKHGSVIYRVLVEHNDAADKPEWKLDYTSRIIRGGETPNLLKLDVTNATRIALLVEMADRADTRDYANWLNARLTRPASSSVQP